MFLKGVEVQAVWKKWFLKKGRNVLFVTYPELNQTIYYILDSQWIGTANLIMNNFTVKRTNDVSAVNPDKSLISTMTMLDLACGPLYLEKGKYEPSELMLNKIKP